jgi:hypothetical protein
MDWLFENLGILSSIIIRLQKSKSFQSEPLDRLAETMQTTEILKKGKLERYYTMRFLQEGAQAYIDTLFFDKKYYSMLEPEELLAIGAHEFNHLNNRHGKKAFLRIFCPTIITLVIIGLLVFSNYGLINFFPFFSKIDSASFSLLFVMFSFPFVLLSYFHVNSKWLRQNETQCDLSAVKFANGEAMISALIKLDQLRAKKRKRSDSRFAPRTHPTLDQRINYIRKSIESEKSEDSPNDLK